MGTLSTAKAILDAIPVNNKIITSSVGATIIQVGFNAAMAAGVVFPPLLVSFIPLIVIFGGAIIGQFTPASVQDCAKDLLVKASNLKEALPELQASYSQNQNEITQSTQGWKGK